MTEAIKQWIADQALKEYPIPPKFIGPANAEMDRAAISSGLTKGIEIAEGFADWANQRYTWVSANWWDGDDDETFTTSQLLEKYLIYLKTLEP